MRWMRRGVSTPIVIVALLMLTLLTIYAIHSWRVDRDGFEKYEPIYGGGSSLLCPQIQAWALSYYRISGGRVEVNYQSLGSGAGQAEFKAGLLDFAGSDPPLKPEFLEEIRSDPERGGVLQFPIIVGSVAIAYNLPELGDEELRLTGDVLAKIYLGEILYWDDEELRALNPNLTLVHERIIAVHRSDGSGTTKIFTEYLSKISESWRKKVGSDFTVQWPVDSLGNGVGGKGNEGVATMIKQTPYSIGYIEFSYIPIAGLKVAKIRNRSGNFVAPSPETIRAAASHISIDFPEPDQDWTAVAGGVIDPGGGDSYPLISFSFIILNKQYPADKAYTIKEFFRWVLTKGQERGYMIEGYVPLPEKVAKIGLKAIEMIEVK